MTEETSLKTSAIDRRALIAYLVTGGTLGTTSAAAAPADQHANEPCNALLWAVAWQQTAAEFDALCWQAYNLARLRLDLALAARKAGNKPLAVITDIDSTILHANSYWGYLVQEGKDFFDDSIWDEWLPENLATPVPGALDFLRYCGERDVEVFYVTSRDQGEQTYDLALRQLVQFGFPQADAEHLYVFRDTSDKTPARHAVEERFEVALMLGDNLNDFRRDYYVTDIDERRALMERDRADWGTKFILLPNATDGHWVRAIFGESEPEATDENRRKLKAAAVRQAWAPRR